MLTLVTVPLGGNAFISKRASPNSCEAITDTGLGNWSNTSAVCSIYFRVSQAEVFQAFLRLKVREGTSKINVSIGDFQSYDVQVQGKKYYLQNIGKFFANSSGYVKVELKGIEKSGRWFADVSDLILENIQGELTQVSEIDDFYFGRRGPSVHLRYNPPTTSTTPIMYFLNEVTVPWGQDVNGAYFMAAGFQGGYFGIQVNSEAGAEQERRILFSVWSDYKTDNPEEVPEDYKVKLIAAGPNVQVQDFGDEGTGQQSFLKYNWEAGVTYRFLIFGAPIDDNNTQFAAWFWMPSTLEWELIASFQKPKVSTHLTNLYSFSENFNPDMGCVERRVLFGTFNSKNKYLFTYSFKYFKNRNKLEIFGLPEEYLHSTDFHI